VDQFLVHVDQDVCVGNGMCRALAPNDFVATASGQSVPADVATSLERVLEAADMCPVGAISVVQHPSG